MLGFLKRILGRKRAEDELTETLLRQAKQMSADLGADLPLADLRPVLIPSSIVADGQWFGPHHHFENLPLSLAWGYVRPENTLQYLSRARADELNAEGIDWRAAARGNLLEESRRRTWTFRRHPEDDSVCVAVILHDDLGCDRLYCMEQLLEMFPDGFRFFVPNRYRAFLLAENAPAGIREQMDGWVREAYDTADVPMSLEPFSHVLLKKALVEAGELAGGT
jgi:hypothetical protein